MIAKKLLGMLLAFMLIAVSMPAVHAHSSSVSSLFDTTIRDGNTYVGTEKMGWLIDEAHHTNGTAVTYKFANNIIQEYKTMVNNAADLWPSPFSISYSSSGVGTIKICSWYPTYLYAACDDFVTNSNGHLTSWTIYINSYYHATEIGEDVIAHEFGHIYGLKDLTSPTNTNKLMYAYKNDRTATAPTARDKSGARVITGYHTNHSWGYRFIGLYGLYGNFHEKYCSSCSGYKTQACTYNANNICTKCGEPLGTRMHPAEPFVPVDFTAEQRRLFKCLR